MEQTRKGSVLKAAILSLVFACATALCVAMPSQAWAAEQVDTLEELKAAVNNPAITEIEVTDTIEVPVGTTVTLNIEGKTISQDYNTNAGYSMILNRGTLTISGNGVIELKVGSTASTSYAINTITNGGTLNINGATIKNTATASANGQIGYAIDNNSGNGNAIVTVNSGTVTASGSYYYDGIRQFANSTTNENQVIINGGSVSSVWAQNPKDGSGNRNSTDVKADLTITNGNIEAVYVEPGTEAEISGGNIGTFALNDTANSIQSVNDDDVNISGGTFNTLENPEFLADDVVLLVNDGANNATVIPEADVANKAAASITKDGVTLYFASSDDAEQALSQVPGAKPNYKVTFEGEGVIIDPEFVEDGGKVTEPDEQAWEGHTFVGWMHNGEAWDFDNDTVEGPMTLTAKWAENSGGVPGTPEPEKDSEKTSTPKTGDAAPFAAVAGIAALAIAGVAVARRQMR